MESDWRAPHATYPNKANGMANTMANGMAELIRSMRFVRCKVPRPAAGSGALHGLWKVQESLRSISQVLVPSSRLSILPILPIIPIRIGTFRRASVQKTTGTTWITGHAQWTNKTYEASSCDMARLRHRPIFHADPLLRDLGHLCAHLVLWVAWKCRTCVLLVHFTQTLHHNAYALQSA